MKTIKVKEMMIPLSEYATVNQAANFYEAVLALEEAQKKFDGLYRHRAILVLDDEGHAVGKIGQDDLIRGLEPGNKKLEDLKAPSYSGFSTSYIKSVVEKYHLWEAPLAEICKKAAEIKVKDLMHTPAEGETVDEEAPLNEAIHQLIMARHQSLLVTRKGKIVGIFRMTDVFHKICEEVKACKF
ncbi:MAG: CBS domain-containing protein [Desulfobacterales bacterium]